MALQVIYMQTTSKLYFQLDMVPKSEYISYYLLDIPFEDLVAYLNHNQSQWSWPHPHSKSVTLKSLLFVNISNSILPVAPSQNQYFLDFSISLTISYFPGHSNLPLVITHFWVPIIFHLDYCNRLLIALTVYTTLYPCQFSI